MFPSNINHLYYHWKFCANRKRKNLGIISIIWARCKMITLSIHAYESNEYMYKLISIQLKHILCIQCNYTKKKDQIMKIKIIIIFANKKLYSAYNEFHIEIIIFVNIYAFFRRYSWSYRYFFMCVCHVRVEKWHFVMWLYDLIDCMSLTESALYPFQMGNHSIELSNQISVFKM